MFGYFRFNPRFVSNNTKKIYRQYYCGLCFALEYTYGEKARLLLSYDVVVLGLLANVQTNVVEEKLHCFFEKEKKTPYIYDEAWKKLATINVLLMKAKIDDDINDESSTKAQIGYMVYTRIIKNAVECYPELAAIVDAGYKKMYELERDEADVLEICNVFGQTMCHLMCEAYNIDDNKQKILFALSRWLYFIDQLDDYDRDVEESKYNPLVLPNVTKQEYVNKHNKILFCYLKEICGEFEKLKQTLDLTMTEDEIIFSLLNESIPSSTVMVINDKELPHLLHFNRNMIWK